MPPSSTCAWCWHGPELGPVLKHGDHEHCAVEREICSLVLRAPGLRPMSQREVGELLAMSQPGVLKLERRARAAALKLAELIGVATDEEAPENDARRLSVKVDPSFTAPMQRRRLPRRPRYKVKVTPSGDVIRPRGRPPSDAEEIIARERAKVLRATGAARGDAPAEPSSPAPAEPAPSSPDPAPEPAPASPPAEIVNPLAGKAAPATPATTALVKPGATPIWEDDNAIAAIYPFATQAGAWIVDKACERSGRQSPSPAEYEKAEIGKLSSQVALVWFPASAGKIDPRLTVTFALVMGISRLVKAQPPVPRVNVHESQPEPATQPAQQPQQQQRRIQPAQQQPQQPQRPAQPPLAASVSDEGDDNDGGIVVSD